jgi:hypothetical protein
MVGDIKHIIVVQSLGNDDTKTGKMLYNDIISRSIDYNDSVDMTHKFYDINDKDSFVKILNEYAITAELMDGGILFHFEMHGSDDLSGLLFSDKSNIDWFEMTDLLREINITVKNNLYVTMATCYGRYLYKGLSFKKKCPYSGYISASREVMQYEIIDDFTFIFERLISSGNLVNAIIELDKNGTNFYYMDLKRIIEENYTEFKANFEFKNQILDDAIQQVKSQGQELPDEELVDFIYNEAMEKVFETQKNNFLF